MVFTALLLTINLLLAIFDKIKTNNKVQENQIDIIIKAKYKDISTYEEILNLSYYDIIRSKEILSYSQIISNYFNNNIEKSSCETKLVIRSICGNKKIIKLNNEIAFGIKLKDFSGNTILSKMRKVLDHKTVYKKLLNVADIYREVYYFSKSKDEYITSFALKRFNERCLSN